MAADNIFTSDLKLSPYWWEQSPLRTMRADSLDPVFDVVIIGAGYTGLHASIQTARAGLSTLVVEADAIGYGCSTRNGGQISTSVKPSLSSLTKRYGEQTATRILTEGQASLDYVKHFVVTEGVDCDFNVVGRFHGAHSKRAFRKLAVEIENRHDVFSSDAHLVYPNQLTQELDTDRYFGGAVFPHHASVDPGRYHAGAVHVALRAGVRLVSHCRANGIERKGADFIVNTDAGDVRARHVVVATNGYTGTLTPWIRRRVIPIGSYVIATEKIPVETMDRLMPNNRVLSDTRRLVYYYRPSPDRRRVIFGGRVSLSETDPRLSGAKLHAELTRLFPDLRATRVSHSWLGYVAYTFDSLMHCGKQDGLYFACGYCGSGVGMAGYLGMRIGAQIAGTGAYDSALSEPEFPTRPFYTGRPWFLAPSVFAYRVLDRLS